MTAPHMRPGYSHIGTMQCEGPDTVIPSVSGPSHVCTSAIYARIQAFAAWAVAIHLSSSAVALPESTVCSAMA